MQGHKTRTSVNNSDFLAKKSEALYIPIDMPTSSRNNMKSQKTFGKAASKAKRLHMTENTNITGFLPILSDKTPPPRAPSNQPANSSEVEMVPSKALSQTRSN